jgi:hypothetical protein
MSDYAITEYDDQPMSAWEFRYLYLREGVEYENFFCPYCDIKLCAYLIYVDGEGVRSPYFSARWERHKFGCDGKAIYVDASVKKVATAYYGTHELDFPEALTARPPTHKIKTKTIKSQSLNLSNAEVFERRKKAGLLGRPVSKTYLLQPIVEMYNSVWADGYKKVDENVWNANNRVSMTTNILSGMPILLEDKTEYNEAFRSPLFLDKYRCRIYHGHGFVHVFPNGFILTSEKSARVEGQTYTFKIKIYEALINNDSPMSHLALFEALASYAMNKTAIRWYAYGTPSLVEDIYELLVINLDYLYIKKPFQKK